MASELAPATPGGWRVWLMAIRPPTLTASVVPVFVGSCTAVARGVFSLGLFFATLAAAILIQIGSNLANDYFDFRKGSDTAERLGPPRVTQTGLISPSTIRNATVMVLTLAAVVSIPVVIAAGWAILVAGLVCIFAAVIYTGGPWPLGYHGLGDLAAFLFFGVVGVCGTHFVQTGQVTRLALLASLPIGSLICAILVVNNLRDIETDTTAGKKTLAVYIGRQATRVEYVLLLGIAFTVPLLRFVAAGGKFFWLPYLSLPLAIALVRSIWNDEARALNRTLVRTAQLNLFFGVLFGVSLLPL